MRVAFVELWYEFVLYRYDSFNTLHVTVVSYGKPLVFIQTRPHVYILFHSLAVNKSTSYGERLHNVNIVYSLVQNKVIYKWYGTNKQKLYSTKRAQRGKKINNTNQTSYNGQNKCWIQLSALKWCSWLPNTFVHELSNKTACVWPSNI